MAVDMEVGVAEVVEEMVEAIPTVGLELGTEDGVPEVPRSTVEVPGVLAMGAEL